MPEHSHWCQNNTGTIWSILVPIEHNVFLFNTDSNFDISDLIQHKSPSTSLTYWQKTYHPSNRRKVRYFVVVKWKSILPSSDRVNLLALQQSYDCPSANEVMLKNMGILSAWIENISTIKLGTYRMEYTATGSIQHICQRASQLLPQKTYHPSYCSEIYHWPVSNTWQKYQGELFM